MTAQPQDPAALPTVQAALSAVMGDVRAVGKDGKNAQQGFKFRGIDAVVNAVGPALRAHGVIVTPHLDGIERRESRTSKGATVNYVAVVVTYTFTGPAGDTMSATVPGEAFDSGDKATAKAMSVAFRTALIQALALPTDESDPDADSYTASAHYVQPHQAQTAAPPSQTERPAFDPEAEARASWNNAAALANLRKWIAQQYPHRTPEQDAFLDSLDQRVQYLQTNPTPTNGAPQ